MKEVQLTYTSNLAGSANSDSLALTTAQLESNPKQHE